MSIPVFKPLIEQHEIDAVSRATEEAWFGSGKYVGEFESKVQELLGFDQKKSCIALNTGTSALHVAMCIAGVGPGDEVIMPSFTFSGVAQAATWTGAAPVFCDVKDDDLCLDPDLLETALSPRTKAVIANDFASNIADHKAISEFCAKNGLRYIHDAAHAFLWENDGEKVGAFSDLCAFSFDPVKVFTCIDAGILVVSSEEDAAAARSMRNLGQVWDHKVLYKNERPPTADIPDVGFRYHLSNVHAAMGLIQLEKADIISKSRQEAFNSMAHAFQGLRGIRAPKPVPEEITPFIFVIRVENGLRNYFQEHMNSLAIDTSVHWQPAHTFSRFSRCGSTALSVTEKAADEVVTLPYHSKMIAEDLEKVIFAVKSFSETINS